jgi:hypothetical protein
MGDTRKLKREFGDPCSGESQNDGPADPGAATCHQAHLSFEFHGLTSLGFLDKAALNRVEYFILGTSSSDHGQSRIMKALNGFDPVGAPQKIHHD